MANWYYGEGGEQRGPVEEHELRGLIAAGKVSGETIIWREGMENWQKLSEVPEWSDQIVSPQAQPQVGTPYQTPAAGGSPGVGAYHPVAPSNGIAIASLVCGIVSFFLCYFGIVVAIPAVICGHIALKQINESAVPMSGRGMAIAGLITGYITAAISLCFGVFMLIAVMSEM